MSRPVLGVVWDRGAAGPGEILRAAADICEVVFVADRGAPSVAPYWDLLRALAPTIEIDDDGLEAPAAALRAAGARSLVTFSDEMLTRTARLAALAGAEFHEEATVALLTDKFEQRRALLEAGVPSARAWLVRPGDTIAVPDDLRGSFVVKPANGSGGRHTYGCADRQAALARVTALRKELPDRAWVVEELLEGDPRVAGPGRGDYVSVECFTDRGVTHPAYVTGKFPLAEPFREVGSIHPATLDADTDAAVRAVAVAAVTALGVRRGATHVELKLTAAGPAVIEVNGRLGGDVARVMDLARGVDVVAMAVRNALGMPWAADRSQLTGVGFSFHLMPPAGARRFRGLLGDIDRARELPGVSVVERLGRLRPGDAVDWRDGIHGYVIRAFASSEDQAGADRLAREIERALEPAFD